MLPASRVSDTLLSLSDPKIGEGLTHLQIEKLLYYVQGWHAAAFGSPAFEDRIEAWKYGPVVPSEYQRFARFGDNVIDPREAGCQTTVDDLPSGLAGIVRYVWDRLGILDGIMLMKMTHRERPWRETWYPDQDDRPHREIPFETIREYFSGEAEAEIAKGGRIRRVPTSEWSAWAQEAIAGRQVA